MKIIKYFKTEYLALSDSEYTPVPNFKLPTFVYLNSNGVLSEEEQNLIESYVDSNEYYE